MVWDPQNTEITLWQYHPRILLWANLPKSFRIPSMSFALMDSGERRDLIVRMSGSHSRSGSSSSCSRETERVSSSEYFHRTFASEIWRIPISRIHHILCTSETSFADIRYCSKSTQSRNFWQRNEKSYHHPMTYQARLAYLVPVPLSTFER